MMPLSLLVPFQSLSHLLALIFVTVNIIEYCCCCCCQLVLSVIVHAMKRQSCI